LKSVHQALAEIIPHGTRCDGCPKGDPHGIAGYSGDVYCHLTEEVMPGGEKDCTINDPRWEVVP
jgi:hypothetical protein